MLSQIHDEDVRKSQALIVLVAPYSGTASDLDGTGYDTEAVTSNVTARLVMKELRAQGKNPEEEIKRVIRSAGMCPDAMAREGYTPETMLTAYVCTHYSGRKPETQVPLIENDFGIKLRDVDSFIKAKKTENVEALSRETLAIEGYEELLDFFRDHKLKLVALTASPPDRVNATMTCSGLNSHLATISKDGTSETGKFPVVSAKTEGKWDRAYCPWDGTQSGIVVIPALPDKPDGDGYKFVAERMLEVPVSNMQVLEDSGPGVDAGAKAGGHVAIITMGSHFPRDPETKRNRISELGDIVKSQKGRYIVIDTPQAWANVVKNHLRLGIQGAREAGVQGLPATNALPDYLDSYVDSHFVTTRKPVLAATARASEFTPAPSTAKEWSASERPSVVRRPDLASGVPQSAYT